VHLSQSNVFGVLSLIIWSLIVVISVKYVLLMLRVDNRGEGGVLALSSCWERDAQLEAVGTSGRRRLARGGALFRRWDSYAGDLDTQRCRRPRGRQA